MTSPAHSRIAIVMGDCHGFLIDDAFIAGVRKRMESDRVAPDFDNEPQELISYIITEFLNRYEILRN